MEIINVSKYNQLVGMDVSQIEDLRIKIIELSIQCISDLKTKQTPFNSFHFELQKLLAEKSGLFNLSSRREYPTNISNKKFGFMDLVWLDGEKPVVAFEIDSFFNISSVWKLLDINTDLRFWVYYNQMTEDELYKFRAKNKDKLITLVKLPVVFDIKPQEEKKIQNYYNRWDLKGEYKPKKTSPQNQPNTTKITYDLLQMNLSIVEIAKQRGLTESTITRHVEELIRMDYTINIDKLVSKEKQENIINASKKLNTDKLSELKQFLGDTYSYDELRFTIALCRDKGTAIKKPSYTLDDVRKEYHNAYIYWTPEDDEKLKELFLSGKTVEEIAKILQRNVGAIDARLKKKIITEVFFE